MPAEVARPQARRPEDLYALLMRERPKLHGYPDGGTFRSAVQDWALDASVLDWLVKRLRPGFRTLETGCGYSTIAFALWGCRHDAISPFAEEHDAINHWCRMRGVSVETVTYHNGRSQRVLPAMDPTPLDLVLIDGDHAVPAPLIDFYYTVDRLVEGGLLLVDDVRLPSVLQLCDFLDAERTRWRFVEQVERTRIYRKRVEGRVIEGVHWTKQRFCTTVGDRMARRIRKIRRLFS